MKLRLILLLTLVAGADRALAAEPKATPAAAAPGPVAPAPASPGSRRGVPATVAATPRNDSSVAPSATFDAFRLITDRNIFNPNRTGRRDRSLDEAPPRPDYITLVGTMESDKGLRAFFDGSEAAFRKALHVGESVDKFKVTKIAPNVVDLDQDGKTVGMNVGQQFRRPPGGEWNLVGADVVRSEAAAAAANASMGKIDPTALVPIPANATPIERLMIERRNKALKQ